MVQECRHQIMDIQAIKTIARTELRVNIRNRWTTTFAFVFATLVVAISYFGLIAAGAAGFQGFTRTSISLLNLVLYLIPLLCLVVGTLSFTNENNAGELLFSQPVSRSDIWLGKLVGLFAAVTISTGVGFGLGGVILAVKAGTSGLLGYPVFVAFSLLLALVFLSLSCLVASACQRKNKAFGWIMFVWFFLVIFYDLLVMGLALLLREHTANQLIFVSLFGNPVGMTRVAALTALNGKEVFGVAGASLTRFLGGDRNAVAALVAGLLLWVVWPLLVAIKLLKRQDI